MIHKKRALNNAYFYCIKTPYSNHQNQSKSVYFSQYQNPITKQIYIYSTFVTLRNLLWDMVLGTFWQKTFVTLLAPKRCDFTDLCYTLSDFKATFVTLWAILGVFRSTFVTLFGGKWGLLLHFGYFWKCHSICSAPQIHVWNQAKKHSGSGMKLTSPWE